MMPRLPPLALAGVALVTACGPAGDGVHAPARDLGSAVVQPAEVAVWAAVVQPVRSVERLAVQYRRFAARMRETQRPLEMLPVQGFAGTARTALRSLLFRDLLQLPGGVAVDLARPSTVALVVPEAGVPGLAATVPVLDAGGPVRPWDVGGEWLRVRGVPVGTDRVAVGYYEQAPADLPALEELGDAKDDLRLVLRGDPAARRLRRWFLGEAARRRDLGTGGPLEEATIALASLTLEELPGVRELRCGLRLGEPGEPGVALRCELEAAEGSELAGRLDPPAPGDFPFAAAIPGAPALFLARRPAADEAAARAFWTGTADRLTAAVEQTVPPADAEAMATVRTALRDLMLQGDGRWLNAAWFLADGNDRQTYVAGVRDDLAARAALRRGAAAVAAIGPALAGRLGRPTDVGWAEGTAVVAGVPVDVLTLREPIQPWFAASGVRPYSVDARIAVGFGRLVMVTGDDWERRLEWALTDAAPDGGLAADEAYRSAVAAAPAHAGLLGRFGLVSSSRYLLSTCGPYVDGPEPALLFWSGARDGRGAAALETSEGFAEELADAAEALGGCLGFFP